MSETNAARDPALVCALRSLAPQAILVDHRLIAACDEDALLADEAATIVPARRRASGVARIVARKLAQRLGCGHVTFPRDEAGIVRWPPGIVGSLAHDERVAVAALARAANIAALGIDIEPAAPLPPDMLDLVASPHERASSADPLHGRLLFCVKEAVYKALYPRDRQFLEFDDITVDLAGCIATTRQGRTLRIAVSTSTHVVALAWIDDRDSRNG
ncbi:MAG: hypothetical protein GHHEDOFH_00762 [Pseudorhodoplanes sp.]|nr:hypothetical protein [Pseudorhodoplanes sp.]